MKRLFILFVFFFFGLFFVTCKKEAGTSSPAANPFINQAKIFFNESVAGQMPVSGNVRSAAGRVVDWEGAVVFPSSGGKAVLAPILYEKDLFIRTTQGGTNNFHLGNLSKILVYQSKDGVFHAEVVTGFPDTNYLRRPSGSFSGMVYVENWAGKDFGKYLYEGGKVYQSIPGKVASPVQSPVQGSNVVTIEVCYQITGYNYSTASPSEGYAWAEAPVCRPSMVPVDDDPVGIDYGVAAGSGGGTGSSASNAAPQVAPPTSVIQNVNSYFQCFTNAGGTDHQYTVTVCVDQPSPGNRTAWVTRSSPTGSSQAGTPVDVGHTFLILTEKYGSTVITRNIGFYPSQFVYQMSPTAQGVLNDDDQHEYNISGSFTVTNADFFSILNYITQGNLPGFEYNLNSNNCTSFAIAAVAKGGINLPSTIGSWPGGMGNDPGDLGEDLRSKNVEGMTLNTGLVTDFAHLNVGECN